MTVRSPLRPAWLAPPRPPTRRWTSAAVAAAVALALVLAGAGWALVRAVSGPDERARAAAAWQARAAAVGFLDRYLAPDGRVVRHDQGGDTVSEGQAYAMLLAAAVGDRDRFDRAWSWTRDHLRRPDGLLSWQWRDGAVVDPEPATDADVDAARALLVAERRFRDPAYGVAAGDLGRSLLESATVPTGRGRVLVAGTWARTEPYTLNPSYLAPRSFRALAATSGDPRWADLRDTVGLVADDLVDDDRLPPDWALITADGEVRAASRPGTAEEPTYGLDAARLVVRLAESCSDDLRDLAAPAADLVEEHPARGVRGLDGRPRVEWQHPVALVAAAAAADAAGRDDDRAARLAEAGALLDRYPTYYGAAWVALGRVVLDTDLLGDCDSAAALPSS